MSCARASRTQKRPTSRTEKEPTVVAGLRTSMVELGSTSRAVRMEADHGRSRRSDESLLLWKVVLLLPPSFRAGHGYMLMVPIQGL
jgi:hypothetical protein